MEIICPFHTLVVFLNGEGIFFAIAKMCLI